MQPRIVVGEAAKFAAFRSARAALAASGTVTLELALAGVPMVGAYKVSRFEEPLKYLIKVPSILLPNLILGERAIPEILQRECTPQKLAAALADVAREGAARDAQFEALSRLDELMRLPDGEAPSARAARLVLQTIAAPATGARRMELRETVTLSARDLTEIFHADDGSGDLGDIGFARLGGVSRLLDGRADAFERMQSKAGLLPLYEHRPRARLPCSF